MPSDPEAKTIPLFDCEFAKRALGTLIAEMSGVKKELPLAAVDIQAKVADRISDVTISQKFRNTFADHLETVYIFPLAHSAVVTSFEMRVGTRVVKGEVKERQEARQDYQTALAEGKRSALMEQERDDVFTMQVGNIAPGRSKRGAELFGAFALLRRWHLRDSSAACSCAALYLRHSVRQRICWNGN
jgi:Ca-activated chloride channel homolog